MQVDRRPPTGFDLESALAITDGDMQLVKELAELFLGDYPRLMANLRSSIQERDAKRLQMSAHALKGAVANFGAQTAVGTRRKSRTERPHGRPHRDRGRILSLGSGARGVCR